MLFNPDIPDVQSDYTRASQGKKSDTSLAGLFESGANLFETAMKGADAIFKQYVRQETTSEVDELRDREINRGALAQGYGAGSNPTVPKEITNEANRLATAKRANESGQIGNSHYFLLLDAAARRLRERFPGYREHIDNVMQDLTGTTPANRAIEMLRSEASKEGKRDERTYQLHQAQQNGNPHILNLINAGKIDETSTEELARLNMAHKVEINKLDLIKKTVETEDLQDKSMVRRITNDVIGYATQRMTTAMQTQQTAGGLTWDRMQQLKADKDEAMLSGKPFQGEAELKGLIEKFKDEQMAVARAHLQHTITDKDGNVKTLAQLIGPKGIDEYLDTSKRYLDSSLNFAAFPANAAKLEALKNTSELDLFTSKPAILRTQTFQKAISPQVANLMLLNSPSSLDALGGAFKQWVLEETIVNGDKDPNSLTKNLDEAGQRLRKQGKSEKSINDMEMGTIYGIAEGIKSGKATPEDRRLLATRLFSDQRDNKDFYSTASRVNQDKLFNMLLHPDMTDTVWNMKDAKAWNRYRTWATDRIGDRLDSAAKDVKSFLDKADSPASIKFDPVTLTFSATSRTPDVSKSIGVSNIDREDYERRMHQRMGATINQLNSTIAHYRPIAEKIGLSQEQMAANIERIFKGLNNVDLPR